ncbi:hypothetical protein PHMEG_00024978 [Phytophthora megakarya]|uniref:Polycystin cation channel PKD1/PKD2 domain-containing protein n=1 Tax=Phytophthora megakarya TaxID=4795 RepID=A0A225VC95_9STRA|nr:hypothetical protein PHMEG_00024978 [Phytophthora megakarya]
MQDAYDSINQDAEIGRALIRLVSTVIFWIIASFALSRRPRTTLQWDQVLAVMDALATNGENVVTDDTPLQFYNIGSIDDVYTWLSDTLVPSVFTTEDFKGDTLPEYQQGRVATLNKVLGGVLIDVTRKAAKSCNADDVVTELYPNCSDSDNTTLERTFMNIKLNSTEASQFIDELKTSDKGINYYTKKMAVTIATYNGDFEGYSITTLEVNFGDSGYIKPTSATNSARGTPILFGSDVEEFSTRLLTTQACINMLFGTFDYDSIKDLQFAFIFYWCFMIVVSLVLLNLMLAIVLDAYTVVREESYKGEASLMLNGRIRDFCLDKFHGKNPARCSAASSQPSDNNVEAQLLYDRIKADIRKLPTEFVILRQKVYPSLLHHVLQVKMELEYLASRRRTKSPMKLSAQILIDTFPAANLTEKQIHATFKYLHEGVIINHSAINHAQKLQDEDRAKQDEDDMAISPHRGDHVLSEPESEAATSATLRLNSLERKLDRLLTEVLTTQAAIRDAGLS